jgi:ribosomal-protein-alanine N-acetyltransferase
MNNLVVEPMTAENLLEVVEINNLCLTTPWSFESLKNELENKFCKYIVIKKDDVVIGYAGLWLIIDEAHITNIAVDPDYRGIGASNVLMDNIIKICVERNIPSITLEVRENNIVARNLYYKYGFIEEGLRKNYYGENQNAIIMWRRT